MEDSLKGLLVTVTLGSLFVVAMLSFITLFPIEQGVTFITTGDNATYLVIGGISGSGVSDSLELINNQSLSGFNEWDVTQGFMGSNTVKQSSGTGIGSYTRNLFTTLRIIAVELFGANSPIVYVIGILTLLAGAWVIYLLIKWVRTGN